MDEISMMVAETYRHFNDNFQNASVVDEVREVFVEVPTSPEYQLPTGPGILYHLQCASSIFVVRTLVSANIRDDYAKILENPENYPSLRLVDEENVALEKLRYFVVDNQYQAEIIHDHLNNRRFPIFEERMCNLSDPGFSWWLSKRGASFQISFNLSVISGDGIVKLGPLGDHQLASKTFFELGQLLGQTGLSFNIQNEINRIQFAEGEPLLQEEFQDLFEFGVIGQGLVDLFKILSRREQKTALLESTWYYLQELACMRRFWIQIQFDLSAADP